jgi:hypothetical protein
LSLSDSYQEISPVENKKEEADLSLSDSYQEILQLKKLLDVGAITEEEFTEKKKKAFGNIT